MIRASSRAEESFSLRRSSFAGSPSSFTARIRIEYQLYFVLISLVSNQRAVSVRRTRRGSLELPGLVNQGLTSLFLESRGILGPENEAARIWSLPIILHQL